MSETSCYDHGYYYDMKDKVCPWCELGKAQKVIDLVLNHYEGLDELNCPGFVMEARRLHNA